jgi:two-component system, cell cycle response regulator
MAREPRVERASGSTILVVDDSPEYLDATRLTLEREGHRVLTCTGGSEALGILRAPHVDLVLLDYFMPGMTGEEVVKQLREFNPYVQVLLQTDYTSERPPRELLRRLDIQGYHDKSDGPDALLLWTEVGLKAAYTVQLLYKSRQGLRYILDATPELHRIQPLEDLLQGILLQVTGLLGAANSFIAMNPARPQPEAGPREAFLAVVEESELVIRVGTGRFQIRERVDVCLEPRKLDRLRDAVRRSTIDLSEDVTIVPLQVGGVVMGAVYIDRPARNEGDAELLGLLANQAAVAIHNAQLYEMAMVDPLTGVYARRLLEQWLLRELRNALRSRQPLSLAMLDLDRFKRINDTTGHVAGDKALAIVGQVLRRATRTTDVAARYGGDEFTLLLPGTEAEGAATLCNRILRMLDGTSVDGAAGPVPVRLSAGCVTLAPATFRPEEIPPSIPPAYFVALGGALVTAADRGVYSAKRAGGHCAIAAGTVSWPVFATPNLKDPKVA